jgi:putative hemolysin
MGSVTLEVLLIVLLIVANGVFSMSEIAILSARQTRLERKAKAGHGGARLALELARSPNRFLSTVQIGITLVGILAGAVGGATLAETVGAFFGQWPALAPYGEPLGLAAVVIPTTYLSLVIGELVPKRLALASAERIACAVSKPMTSLSRLGSPIVKILTLSTEVVLRAFRIRPSSEPPVTEEEVKILIEQGAHAGVFEQAEKEIVHRVFRLGDYRAVDLMTRRTEVVWLDIKDPPMVILERIKASGFSRFPVAPDTLDQVCGIVRAKDLLAQCAAEGKIDLNGVLREPIYVPESTPAITLLELFKKSGAHIALVVDEYGGIRGLITHHDVLESIVGDISETPGVIEQKAVQREDGSWLIDGLLSIDDFRDIFPKIALPGVEECHTVGGFAMLHLERVASAGDHFEIAGLRFEIVDMDARRIDKLLVSPGSTLTNHGPVLHDSL